MPLCDSHSRAQTQLLPMHSAPSLELPAWLSFPHTCTARLAGDVAAPVFSQSAAAHALTHTPPSPHMGFLCACLLVVWLVCPPRFVLQETSCGQFAPQCVATTARIIADASGGLDLRSNYNFIRNFTPKPLPSIEVRAAHAAVSAVCGSTHICSSQFLNWLDLDPCNCLEPSSALSHAVAALC